MRGGDPNKNVAGNNGKNSASRGKKGLRKTTNRFPPSGGQIKIEPPLSPAESLDAHDTKGGKKRVFFKKTRKKAS